MDAAASRADAPPIESTVAAAPRRRWSQFSLRTLLVAMLLSGLLLGYIGYERREAARFQTLYAELAANKDAQLVVPESRRPRWLRFILGDNSSKFLRSVWIDSRKFDDDDLTRLANFRYLEHITLINTRARGSGLAAFARHPRLRGLRCVSCPLDNSAVPHIANIRGLRELDLSLTEVTGESLVHVEGLVQLRHLGLGGTKIDGPHLRHLSALKNLRYLELSGTQVNDAGLAHLADLPLDQLGLAGTRVTDAGLYALHGLPLRSLDLGRTGVRGGSVRLFLPFQQLKVIDLQETLVSDLGAHEVAQLPRLEQLNLDRTEVSDAIIPELAKMPRLLRVTLTRTFVTPAGIQQLQTARPALVINP
jgi:internalin A